MEIKSIKIIAETDSALSALVEYESKGIFTVTKHKRTVLIMRSAMKTIYHSPIWADSLKSAPYKLMDLIVHVREKTNLNKS